MKVAFHLRRRPEPAVATALLLETDRFEPLLALTEHLGRHASPSVHQVQGGFLVELASGVDPPPGPIRLRSLADNLYLPADADLIPALLDDEARGLTRDRGLVFLPGGRVLGFDPGSPLNLSSLVTARRIEGADWKIFPARAERPDRLREIILAAPPGAGEEDLLGPGPEPGQMDGDGSPRDEEAGTTPSSLAGKAAVGAGKGLQNLGELLGIKALADLGSGWINRTLGKIPRLTEAMLGKQEGALRELLRQFREGDVERALRHALPLGGDGERGGTPCVDGKLPDVDPTYSLQSILGSNRGPTGLWFGGGDIQAELAREYRKAADEAERRGDYRRAAYIHGRLLNDFLTAAMLLSRVGLHRDAAYLYLNRLRDIASAARSFEAAGEADRALELYRQARRHADAGDLLRRVGEEDEALVEYALAADLLAADSRQGPLAAGDLLRDRAGRPDLAMNHYAIGWLRRPTSAAVPCALRMASILAERGETRPLLALVDEAHALLNQPGPESSAVEFYNEIARLANFPSLAEIRDDLRDRSLMGLAAKLRQQVASRKRTGPLASAYLGRGRTWPNDLVHDASLAVRAALDAESERRRGAKMVLGPSSGAGIRRIEVGAGPVSAACHAPATGEVFLGFEAGRIYRFNPASGDVSCLTEEHAPVTSIAVDPDGRMLVALLGEGSGPRQLLALDRGSSAGRWSTQTRMIEGPGDFWLTPVLDDGNSRSLGIWNGEEMILMAGDGDLLPLDKAPDVVVEDRPSRRPAHPAREWAASRAPFGPGARRAGHLPG